MYAITNFIDTVYGTVIQGTVRCITAVCGAYGFPLAEVTAPTYEERVPEVTAVEDVPEEKTFRRVQDILKTKAEQYTEAFVVKNTVMYSSHIRVPVYKNPTIEFDAQVGEIPFGEMVMMLEARGRFFRVVWGTLEGWVLKEDLADRAVHVYPEFVIGEENSVDSENTAHVRAIIGDVFGVGRSEFALQAGEYVLYKLWRKGIRITWPLVRPRVPGLWHKILKGRPEVHVGVIPKVGTIMEYMFNTDIGHLAYVEAVFPDDTITISEVNYPDAGIYNERVLTKEEWKELRPVFIKVV